MLMVPLLLAEPTLIRFGDANSSSIELVHPNTTDSGCGGINILGSLFGG
jgi:hypothetical protein